MIFQCACPRNVGLVILFSGKRLRQEKWISKAAQGWDAFQECRGDRGAVSLPLAGHGGHRSGIGTVERHGVGKGAAECAMGKERL